MSACSLFTYAETAGSQSKEAVITSCANAVYYYSGVPRARVADSLKTAVIKAGRYEAALNEEFERFAGHYGAAAVPARLRKPKDKARTENAVKLTCKARAGRLEAACRPAPNYGRYCFLEVQDMLKTKSKLIGLSEETPGIYLSTKTYNATANREYLGHKYNYVTRQVDLDHETIVIPNLSYKIEF